MADSKVRSTSSVQGAQASKSGGENSGPTGSSRHYPKGKGVSMSASFNPQKIKPTCIYVGGV